MKLRISSLALVASGCIGIAVALSGCGPSETGKTDGIDSPAGNARKLDVDDVEAHSSSDSLVDYAAVSIVGRGLQRNKLLAGLVAHNDAVQTGSVADRLVDINEQQTTTAHLLSLLLTDTTYSAKFAPQANGRTRLLSLTLQESIPEPVEAGHTRDTSNDDRQVQIAEINEERAHELADIISNGEPEEVTAAIDQIDITPGGIELLSSLVAAENPVDIQLAAMRRLDLADEYAAKGIVLAALNSTSSDVVLAAIESIEVWRDATVLPQITALLGHNDKRIRQHAQTLSDDLQSYLVTQQPEDPDGVSYSTDLEEIFPDTTALEEAAAELLPKP